MDEPDIDNLIRAKVAIFAGLSSMLKKLSLDIMDIDRFHVAGGIGGSLPIASAVKLGLLPPFLGTGSCSAATPPCAGP